MWCAISTPVFYPPSAPSPCLSDVNNKRIPSRPIPSRRGCSDCGELLRKSDEPTAWLSLERHWHRTALLQERPSTQEPLQITILPIHHPGVKPSTSSYSDCYICWTRQVFLYTRPWHNDLISKSRNYDWMCWQRPRALQYIPLREVLHSIDLDLDCLNAMYQERRTYYSKIPIISSRFIFIQKAFLVGLFSGGLIFEGAFYWRDFAFKNGSGLATKTAEI